MSGLVIYIIAVNVIGFALFLIGMRRSRPAVEKMLCVVSILGGALGQVIGMVLFDRRPNKENMLSRVLALCLFALQLQLFLILQFAVPRGLSFEVWHLFARARWLLPVLAVINIVTLIAFGADKSAAVHDRRRVPIVTLLGLCFIGGSVGGLIAMAVFRHKTKKAYFTVTVPLMLVMQLAMLVLANSVI